MMIRYGATKALHIYICTRPRDARADAAGARGLHALERFGVKHACCFLIYRYVCVCMFGGKGGVSRPVPSDPGIAA